MKTIVSLKYFWTDWKFKDNLSEADLAEMGTPSSKNRGDKYLLCVMFSPAMFGLGIWKIKKLKELFMVLLNE